MCGGIRDIKSPVTNLLKAEMGILRSGTGLKSAIRVVDEMIDKEIDRDRDIDAIPIAADLIIAQAFLRTASLRDASLGSHIYTANPGDTPVAHFPGCYNSHWTIARLDANRKLQVDKFPVPVRKLDNG